MILYLAPRFLGAHRAPALGPGMSSGFGTPYPGASRIATGSAKTCGCAWCAGTDRWRIPDLRKPRAHARKKARRALVQGRSTSGR